MDKKPLAPKEHPIGSTRYFLAIESPEGDMRELDDGDMQDKPKIAVLRTMTVQRQIMSHIFRTVDTDGEIRNCDASQLFLSPSDAYAWHLQCNRSPRSLRAIEEWASTNLR